MGVLEDALVRLKAALDEVVDAATKDDKTPLMNQPALRQFGERLVQGKGLDPSREVNDEIVLGIVAYGDVNNFKAFNARHSHDVADLALNAVGVQLHAVAVLCHGKAFRRSGDEFVLLLPAAGIEMAVAEIGSRMNRLEVDLRGISPSGDAVDFVTLSFGYARTGDELTLTDLLQRAEQACDVAKRLGPGVMIEWVPSMEHEAPVDLRSRCSSCNTTVSLSIPTDRATPLTQYPCPVCAARLPR